LIGRAYVYHKDGGFNFLRTGLTGLFDFHLEYAFLGIDHVERPTGN